MGIKLNIGSGESKLEGFVNLDTEDSTKPDVVHDLRKNPLPFEDGSCEVVTMIHSLEHIEQKFWDAIFFEFYRVLILEGELILAYPEFETCAQYFIENHQGLRDFWRQTLYGRQLYPGDYHVTPMRTAEVIERLQQFGFHEITSQPEPDSPYNTFLIAKKGRMPKFRENILKEQLFK